MSLDLPTPGGDAGTWAEKLNNALNGTGPGTLSATYGAPDLLTAMTQYVTTDGNDARDGESWNTSKATIQAALDAIPADASGVIEVGAGTFAPFTIDSTTEQRRGITIRGRGLWATDVHATAAGQDAAKFISAQATSIQFVALEDMAFTGTRAGVNGAAVDTGHGISLGGDDWNQIGNVTIHRVRVEGNGKSGILAHDINECSFAHIRSRLNGQHGFHFSSNGADLPEVTPVMTGNTWVMTNCGTYDNLGHGILLDSIGNSVTILGGELHDSDTAGTAGLFVNPGNNTVGITLIGVHFEHNDTAAILGDFTNNPTRLKHLKMVGCHFTQSATGVDVVLDGVDGVDFDGCYGNSSTVMFDDVGSGKTAQSYRIQNCMAATAMLRRAGTTYNKLHEFRMNSGVRVVRTSSAQGTDAYAAAIYAEQATTLADDLLRLVINSGGTLYDFFRIDKNGAITRIGNRSVTHTAGAGSPEGVVSAPVGSIYTSTVGAAGTTLYVKEGGGTGNTGWVAK